MSDEEKIEISKEEIEENRENTSDLFSVVMEGYEIIEKQVKSSGNTGRIYLPTEWIGSYVKVVRVSPIDRNRIRKKRKRSGRIEYTQ